MASGPSNTHGGGIGGAAGGVGAAQIDAFLELDGIKGESSDAKHKDKIDVISWGWGMANTGSAHYGGGMGAGKVQVNDLSLVKRVDKSSPILMQSCTKGTHIAEGMLRVRKSGGDNQLEYFKVKLKDILVSSVTTHSEPGSPWLMEEVTLNFAEFLVQYTPQDQKGGGGAQVEFGYNLAKNKAA